MIGKENETITERRKNMWNRIDLKMRGKAAFRLNYWSGVGTALLLALLGGGIGGVSASINVNGSLQINGNTITNKEALYNLVYTGVFLALMIVAMLGTIYSIFVGNVIAAGGCRYFTQNQTEPSKVEVIFSLFKGGNYLNIVLTMFMMNLFIFLWSLLFVIPGIIKSYSYRMVPYILAENPSMDWHEAMAISKRMMRGRKWQTFVYDLSFIGWYILNLFTFGFLAIFFINPYKLAADAEIYTANRQIAFEEGYIQ